MPLELNLPNSSIEVRREAGGRVVLIFSNYYEFEIDAATAYDLGKILVQQSGLE